MRAVAFAVMLFGLAACGGATEDPTTLDTGITITGHFGEDGDASEDVSGLACEWQADGDVKRCLLVEDEGDAAQWVTFDGSFLRAGRRFGLLAGPSVGTLPRGICADSDPESREFDGEAIAADNGAFYVTGSHGCSRESDEYRSASFAVVRVTPDEPDTDVSAGTVSIERSHRLSAMLARDPVLERYFGASLNRANGITIEGLAVRGDRMVFGLRAPVIAGQAYLFETSVTAMFSRDIVGSGRAVPISLGPRVGIRDLALLPDGRLLILSGPAQEQDVPYRIHLRDTDGALASLSTVESSYGRKAEALAIVGMDGDTVSLLVMFDGVADGAPRLIDLNLMERETL